MKNSVDGMNCLIGAVQQLSLSRTLEDVIEITRHAARSLTGADGATFILREGDRCYYVDEDAIGPLWKGKRFPMSSCISGWVMINGAPAVIEDIFTDPRIPIDAYLPTFVKSLVMVPIRENKPIGAIGNYWAKPHKATAEEVRLLRALADSTSIALENVQLLSDLTDAKLSLEASLRSRDEFLALTSHELRTPLNVLKLQLQITERQAKVQRQDVSQSDLLLSSATSLKQVARLATLVEQLLDVSRIRLGNLRLDCANFNLSQMIEETVERLMPTLNEANCDVHFMLDDRIEGKWDQSRVSQILTILLTNACKYAHGTPITIHSRMDDRGSAILTVEDEGPGIPAEIQKRIFDRFGRGVTFENFSGMGLGLYIARGLVHAHGGHIRVENAEDSGTRFIVELPI